MRFVSILKYLTAKKQIFALSFLILISLFLRFYQLSLVPSSLYYDEIDLGYQARSLIQTHKDYRGKLSPFYVLSFVDAKTPIPVYLSIPATLIFSNEELQVRATPAIVGTAVAVLAFFLTFVLTKSILASTLAGLTFATNPWQIQFSRIAFEDIFAAIFYMFSLLLFFQSLEKKKSSYLILASIFFGLSLYTYRVTSFFTPLAVLILTGVFFKELKKFGFKVLLICLAIFLFITVPFLYETTIGSPDLPRFNIVSIFSNQIDAVQIQRDRELDSGNYQNSTLGKQASKTSYFFHNKLLSLSHDFFFNWFDTYSTNFLFLSGATNLREGVGQMGELFYIDVIPLAFGLFFIGKNLKDKKYLSIFLIFLTSPIPSALTSDGARHADRLFIFSIPLLLIVTLGWWRFIKSVKNLKYSKIIFLSVFFLWLLCFIFYLHRYFVEFPVESASSYGYGFKQAALDVDKLKGNFKYIYMSPNSGPPMLYYLFWSNTPSLELQQYGGQFDVGRNLSLPLDKFKVTGLPSFNPPDLPRILKPNILYVETSKEFTTAKSKNDFPSGIDVYDIIYNPDDTPAFFIFSLDKNYRKTSS